MMVQVLCSESLTREFRQEEILLVGGVVGTDDAELAVALVDLLKLRGDGGERLRPGNRLQLAIDAQQRRLQTVGMIEEIEGIAAFDAEKLAVDAGAVAIVAANDLVVARADRSLAAVGAVGADGADVLHFPGARLIPISTAGERSDRADVDAHAAFVALEMIADVGRDLGDGATVDDAERADAHAFVADAHAAEAEDATRAIVEDDGRPLFFVDVQLVFGEAAFAGSVAKDHVLQFALAAFVADGAIERMVGEEEFERGLAGGCYLRGFGADDHAFGNRKRAGGHQLRHLLDFDQAHAAGGLQGEAFVIAEGGDFDAVLLGGVDHERAWGGFDCLAVDGEIDGIRHGLPLPHGRGSVHRGTAGCPGALRTRRGTFRRRRWWAWQRRRRVDRRCGRAYSSQARS